MSLVFFYSSFKEGRENTFPVVCTAAVWLLFKNGFGVLELHSLKLELCFIFVTIWGVFGVG